MAFSYMISNKIVSQSKECALNTLTVEELCIQELVWIKFTHPQCSTVTVVAREFPKNQNSFKVSGLSRVDKYALLDKAYIHVLFL